MAYSTIIKKKRKLDCGCFDYAFSKNRCRHHATVEDTQKRIDKYEAENSTTDEQLSFQYLVDDLDTVVSLYIRNAAANNDGIIECFTCGKKITIAEAQCSHFIPRRHFSTRWFPNNLKAACKECNEYKSGNLDEFEKRLGEDMVEYLRDLSKQIFKPTQSDLKEMIFEFRHKLELVKRKLK